MTMAVEADVMGRIAAQVTRGVTKDESALVTDAETAAYWDMVEADVAGMKGKNYVIDQPSDITGSVMDYFGMQPGAPSASGETDAVPTATDESDQGGADDE